MSKQNMAAKQIATNNKPKLNQLTKQRNFSTSSTPEDLMNLKSTRSSIKSSKSIQSKPSLNNINNNNKNGKMFNSSLNQENREEIYYQINLQNIIATISSNCLSYSLLCSFFAK